MKPTAPAQVPREVGYLLSLSRSATNKGLDVSEWGLLIAGLVLLVGIVGEYKLPTWHHLLKRFEALVLIGVLLELLFDGGIFFFTSHLQTILDAESETLRHAIAFRVLDKDKFLAPLKGKPIAKVSVWYVPEDVESLSLANEIAMWIGKGLNNDGAGWLVKEFRSIPATAVPTTKGVGPNAMSLPIALRFEGGSGITILSSPHPTARSPKDFESPLWWLTDALRDGVGVATWNLPQTWITDDSLVIVVGQKPPPSPPNK